MSDGGALGTRMKRYEQSWRAVLPPRAYTIMRLDGRAFHTLARQLDLKKPFDLQFAARMDDTAKAVCAEVTGCKFAYIQSDEISLLISDFATLQTQPWFGGVVQKMVSVAASRATWAFERSAQNSYQGDGPAALFDCRVFSMADAADVRAYFTWRQRDCVKNSISMTAQANFSHRSLQNLNSDQLQEKLFAEKKINWIEQPEGFKNGRVILKENYDGPPIYIAGANGRPGRTHNPPRTRWASQPAQRFGVESGWLVDRVPLIGSTEKGTA